MALNQGISFIWDAPNQLLFQLQQHCFEKKHAENTENDLKDIHSWGNKGLLDGWKQRT